MFLAQFLGAFNDNFFKQALILLLTYQGAQALGMSVPLLNNLAALLFILPFFLLSSTAGQLADVYSKQKLTVYIKLLELFIAVIAAVGFMTHNYLLLFVALFLLGVQSSFFGPIKYAYLPEALPSHELVGGNALFQSGTSFSILAGMIVAGVLLKFSGDLQMVLVSLLVIAVAAGGLGAALLVPRTHPHADPSISSGETKLSEASTLDAARVLNREAIDWRFYRTTFTSVAEVWQNRGLFYVLIGISWFWFYGATLLTQIPEVTQVYVQAEELGVISLLLLFLAGVMTGSLLCKRLGGAELSFKLLPYALVGLSLFTLDMAWSLQQILATPEAGLAHLTRLKLYVDLLGIGVSGGLYIVPLYAIMQGKAQTNRRARVVAANNILNALFMVVAALLAIIVLSVMNLSISALLVMIGALNALVGYLVLKKTQNLLEAVNH